MPDDLTKEQIDRRLDELARQFAETHDKKIVAEINELSRRLFSRNLKGAALSKNTG